MMKIRFESLLGKGGLSLVAQLVKNPPAMQEALVQSLGGEDPLEKEMATHSRWILSKPQIRSFPKLPNLS